jgi:hypothetical protein
VISGAPVIFFFTGGPGCSSAIAMFQELGPWRIEGAPGSEELRLNPQAWNAAGAYVVFVDQPAGVGFSHPYAPTSDDKAAEAARMFLSNFRRAMPEALSNAPWILAGESYSGVSLPLIARRVLDEDPSIPLRGILVGNGIMSREMNSQNYPEWLRGHSLISDDFFGQLDRACDGVFWKSNSTACSSLLASIGERLGSTFNMYDMYAPCPAPVGDELYLRRILAGLGAESGFDYDQDQFGAIRAATRLSRAAPVFGTGALGGAGDNCVPTAKMSAYLNRADVKAALHADPSITWELCRSPFNLTRDYSSLVDQYAALLGRITMEIYNGDADTVINAAGAQQGVLALAAGHAPSTPWTPWYLKNTQIGGYAVSWADLKLVFRTVKGAGHMVPQFKPEAAFEMVRLFLGRIAPK